MTWQCTKYVRDVEADDKFLGPLSFRQFLFFGGFGIHELWTTFVNYGLSKFSI
jgi:hypothetical protein